MRGDIGASPVTERETGCAEPRGLPRTAQEDDGEDWGRWIVKGRDRIAHGGRGEIGCQEADRDSTVRGQEQRWR